MKVITVLQKVCEYLQLNDVREYAKNLQEYYEKLDLANEITNQDTNNSENYSQDTEQINDENYNNTNSQEDTSDLNINEDNMSTSGNLDNTGSQLEKPTADDEILFDFNILLECFNNVMKHIAIKYCPLYHKEFVDITQGYLDIDSLKYNPYRIKRICDEFNEYKVRVIDGLIPLTNGNYLVEYQFVPESLSEQDEIINFNNRLLLQGYIYGINSEFSLIRGDQTGSKMWDEKYIDIMKDISQDIKNVVVKRRRWI